jgi:hypothetical protein
MAEVLDHERAVPEADAQNVPLLFARRESIVLDPKLGSTTVCQTTAASDFTPDD